MVTLVNYARPVPPRVSQLTLVHEVGTVGTERVLDPWPILVLIRQTLSEKVGHNFGSPHDFPASCRPGGGEGNFVMFASATDGYKTNNRMFSACSKANISAVLDALQDEARGKVNCFEPVGEAYCGNKIKEEGEDCDCGFDDEEVTRPILMFFSPSFYLEQCAAAGESSCCYPRTGDGRPTKNDISCKLKPGRIQTSDSVCQKWGHRPMSQSKFVFIR